MQFRIAPQTNYYHFMTEQALALFRTLKEANRLDSRDCTLWYDGPFRDMLRLFSCRLVLPAAEAPADTGIRDLITAPLRLREEFRELLPLRDFLSRLIVPAPMARGITVIRRQHNRHYEEHDELMVKLKRFGLPIREAMFEAMSFEAQVNLARATDLLILPHGAAYVNMMFMPEGSGVIELNPKGYGNWHVGAMSDAFGHRYVDLESATKGVLGREPSARVKHYLATQGWPDRRSVRAWLPDRLEIERVVRDVKSFSIPADSVIAKAAALLGSRAEMRHAS